MGTTATRGRIRNGAGGLVVLLTVALVGLVPPSVSAQPEADPPEATRQPAEQQLITMDFQDVELAVLVKFISEITGKNFILDEKVRGKVTVISPTKITIDEAYRVFQSILEVKGFTTVPAGPVTKIVAIRDAKQAGAPLAVDVETGDQFVTQLVPLNFVDPNSLLPVLQPMVSKDGLISAYEPTNALIMIDTASNIDRLIRVISELDVEVTESGIEVIALEHAFATELAATLSEILQATEETGAAEGGTPQARRGRTRAQAQPGVGIEGAEFSVIPDERTNSLIVVASPTHMRTIRSMISELDRELEGLSKINVYRLRYANSIEMVQVLSELVGGGSGVGGLSDLTSPTRRTTRQQIGNRSSTDLRSQLGQALGQRAGTGGGGTNLSPATAAGSGGEFVGEVRITADPFTNSLVISAAPQDYETLRRVIEELDIPRRQVLVEAIILEVTLDKSRQLGLEFQGGTDLGDGVGIGRINLDSLNDALTNPASISGLVLAAASDQTVTIGGREVPAQVALFKALQSDTDVNILSAPTILTSDNQEAEILVGQNIPFIASRATDTTNLANTFATVDRQDVGITLRLTPQISEGNVVRLDIYEEVSAVVPNPPVDPNIAGPTTTVRSASTTIVAKDGHTVAIGGLISDNITKAESKIPFLGDVPVLGNLFKLRDDRTNKINLLIFLTPHVVRSDEDLQQVSTDRRNELRNAIRRHEVRPDRSGVLDSPTWGDLPPAVEPTTPTTPREARPRVTPPAVGGRTEPLAPPARSGATSSNLYWEPSARAARPAAPEPAPPAALPAPRPEPPVPVSPSAERQTGHHYAVLLSFWEEGTPPPGLETTNGFLTLHFPGDTPAFFEKGATYEYESAQYRARYSCLEVFRSADEALAVYPEGRSLDRWGGGQVDWRLLSGDEMQRIAAGGTAWQRAH